MTPEMALRMRVFLEALCAALTGCFPFSRRLKAAFAAAFAWLDRVVLAAEPVACVAPVAAVAVPVKAARRVRARPPIGGTTKRRAGVTAQTITIIPARQARPLMSPGFVASAMAVPNQGLFAKS